MSAVRSPRGRAMRRRLAAAGLLAGALAVPAVASAERTVAYSVTIEGDATYAYHYASPDTDLTYDSSFTWRTELPGVVFEGDQVRSAGNAGAISSAQLLSAIGTRISVGGFDQCTPEAISDVFTGQVLEDDGIPTPEPTIGLRVLGGVILDFGWCPGLSATRFGMQGVLVDGRHTYDTWFHIPREAIGMGRIIQLVHEDVTGRRCPENLANLADCHLVYDATVTFDKISDSAPVEELPPDDGGSLPDPGSVPDIPLTPGPHRPDPEPLAPDGVVIRAASAKLPASAAKATLLVSCPADCTGSIEATVPGRRGPSAGKKVVVQRRPFKLAGGPAQRVVVRFSRAAQRRIRNAGAVVLRVRTDAGGKTDEQVVSLPLKPNVPSGGKGGPRPLSSGKG